MLFCSVKLNLEVFCTEGDAKGLLAAAQVLLQQQLHTEAPPQRRTAAQEIVRKLML